MIVEVVRAGGSLGAPGVVYAALMSQGCSLETYETFTAALVGAGRLTKRGHCYFVAAFGLSSKQPMLFLRPPGNFVNATGK